MTASVPISSPKFHEELGRNTAGYDGDVSKLAGCEKVIQQIINTFGQLDILINHAPD